MVISTGMISYDETRWGALLTIIAYMPLIILAIKLSAGKI